MKGRISLGDFIQDVKKELVEAQDKSGDPFYELDEVRLEVSFVLDVTAKAGGRLVVVELGGETKAQQTHKVSLVLRPLAKPGLASEGRLPTAPTAGGGGGGGGGGGWRHRPKYR